MVDNFVVWGYIILILDLFNGDVMFNFCFVDFDFMGWFIKGVNGNNLYIVE